MIFHLFLVIPNCSIHIFPAVHFTLLFCWFQLCWSLVSRLLHLTFLTVSLGFIRNFFPIQSRLKSWFHCETQVNAQLWNICRGIRGVQPGLVMMSGQLKYCLEMGLNRLAVWVPFKRRNIFVFPSCLQPLATPDSWGFFQEAPVCIVARICSKLFPHSWK